MNKLLFKYKKDWGEEIILIANNHKDLEDYLRKTYNWIEIDINEDCVNIKERIGFATEIAELKWVKHI